ncbi:glycosyl hydrolase [Nibricoccus aquaticus]|uniref:Glycosyl hydrolase n=1 Tax=Nibricoccus aquaticus TaxID=2576891 RepID=A0A290Q4F0_9BACT|nr:glycoside hydrolase family 30 beta sandwich domain-containing protein [Nibricoccus aquaticus]ATC63555.1 glycosyl hydrolase [Nibricoccus aquaticus]
MISPISSSPAFLLTACLLATTAHAQKSVDVYLTAKDSGERLSKVATLSLGGRGVLTEKEQRIFVDPAKTFQTLLGIGGALTDASAETYFKLPVEKRRELIRAYYDSEHGIGYSLGRTHINSCDFSSASYTYVAEGDTALKTFSIAPDEKHRIPFIKDALAAVKGPFAMYASPWSPPAWMKDNNHMLRGGKLKPEMRDAWARYYVAFIQAYEKAGIPIWGLTVQNEPMAVQRWESCVYTAEEEKDFVRDHLGPVLAKSGMADKKIVIWDHNRTWIFQRAQAALNDPEAAKYIWGVGFHWYSDDAFDNVRLVKETYPQTHLLFTEGCNFPYDRTKLSDWNWGELYGRSMIKDFNNGADGWTDWNVLLDETGGPNHVKNFCYAPVHADTQTGELMYMNSYYYIGHFSKFIRPGAKRVISSSTVDRLLTTAFKNADGSVAVVVMNSSGEAQAFALTIGQQSVPVSSPAHSILTLVVR